jgi:glycosyltransferase involved in cell wall biosynthesis
MIQEETKPGVPRNEPASTAESRPIASVVITTKNRRDELRNAVASALLQSVPIEVLVIDDGSTDGSSEMVRAEFPSVRLIRSELSNGYIVQRNRAALVARGEYIFSIDDDAIFTSPETVAQTLAEFNHPRVGAVAIPFVEPKKSDTVYQLARDSHGIFVTHYFIGTAHALRKELFVQLGGYREHLVHQGEETDFCLRMLNAGYVVRLGSADVIHHMESPKRDFRRMDYYGRRNDILFGWHNVPGPYLLPHLAATSLNGLAFGVRQGRSGQMLSGLLGGFVASARYWSNRSPASPTIYRLHRRLRKSGPRALDEIEPLLPILSAQALTGISQGAACVLR